MKFNTGQQSYSLFAESTDTPGRAGSRELLDPATGFAYVQTLNEGEFAGVRITTVSFDQGVYLGFDWMGAPLSAGEAALSDVGVISFSGGHRVTIEPLSGSAHISP